MEAYQEMERVLMTTQKYRNKVQEYAAKVGITRQVDLRRALAKYGIAEATARFVWLAGASETQHYGLIKALEEVLQTNSKNFIDR